MMRTGTKSKKDLEAAFQRKCTEYIESVGGWVCKVHVSAYQKQGIPDLLVCYKGTFIGFELKIPGNETSALQKKRIAEINQAGGVAKAIYSLEEIKETLYEISRIQQDNKS